MSRTEENKFVEDGAFASDSVDFDFDAFDPEPDVDALASEVVASVLTFVFAFVFAGRTTSKTAFRRFVALCYIVRPDLIGDRTQGDLGHELKVSKSEIAKQVRLVRDELGIEAPHLRSLAARVAIRAGQLRARAAKQKPPVSRTKGGAA